MGLRGRPRKTTAELRVHGNFRDDRHGEREGTEPECSGEPERPSDLSDDAAWLWDFVVPEMVRNGSVKRIDTAAIIAACDLWGKYRLASRAAESDPLDKDIRIAVTAYYQAFDRAATKLGLSPVDRTRLKTEKKEKPKVRSRDRA